VAQALALSALTERSVLSPAVGQLRQSGFSSHLARQASGHLNTQTLHFTCFQMLIRSS